MAFESDVRPWGSWHVIDRGDGFAVKRIQVTPGQRLSYQTHEFRAEHWYVVSGVATCLIEDETVVLQPGEAVDIGIGHKHRLSNLQEDELILIEVQRGSYLGEDDIVRLEDDYGHTDA